MQRVILCALSHQPQRMCLGEDNGEGQVGFLFRKCTCQFFMQVFFSEEFCYRVGYELHQAMRDMAPPTTRPKEFLKTFNSEII